MNEVAARLIQQLLERFIKRGFSFEANARGIWKRHISIFDGRVVGKAAKGLEDAGVRFAAAQFERSG